MENEKIIQITYIIIINSIGFLICYIDKRKAINKKYRIPEKTLFLISSIGGALGFYLGINIFHHKTSKLSFKLLIPIICFLWIIIIYKIII